MAARAGWLLALGIGLVAGCGSGSGADTAGPSPSATVDLGGDADTTLTANGKALHVSCSGKGPVTVVRTTGPATG
jgi:hypothetical protein